MRGGVISSILKGKSWRFNCYSSGYFFQRECEGNERKRRKEDQQLSSGIKVYTEKSLNVGFEFVLIVVAFPCKVMFHQKRNLQGVCCSFLRNFFSPKWFLLNREFDQTFRTILQPSFNGLIAAAGGPPGMLTSELTVNVNI